MALQLFPSERRPEETPPSKLRVLIVTTDAKEAAALSRTIREWGYGVEISADYRQAGTALRRRHYDLALVDIDLDGQQGEAWLPGFRLHRPDLDIVVITGDPSIERERQARSQSLALYLVRPLELSSLGGLLQHLANKKRAHNKVTEKGVRRS